MTAFATASSGLLEEDAPQAALKLNPFNDDARIAAVRRALPGADPAELARLREQARAGLTWSAGDARLFALVGLVDLRAGDVDRAYRYIDRARALSKTDVIALEAAILRSVGQARFAEAMSLADTLMRRWPDSFARLAPLLPAIVADAQGYSAALAAMALRPPWRGRLFALLTGDQRTLPVADRLLGDLASGPAPGSAEEVAAAIRGHLRQRQYEAAYRLFLFTLAPEAQALRGYVFNSRFAPLRTSLPFDWEVPPLSVAETSFLGGASGTAGQGFAARFLDKPVRGTLLRQTLQLPPGAYMLRMESSGQKLKLPRALFWSLSCVDPGSAVARLEVAQGDYSHLASSVAFTIPETCRLQALVLESGLLAESWRFRFSGVLMLHGVTIERLAA